MIGNTSFHTQSLNIANENPAGTSHPIVAMNSSKFRKIFFIISVANVELNRRVSGRVKAEGRNEFKRLVSCFILHIFLLPIQPQHIAAMHANQVLYVQLL